MSDLKFPHVNDLRFHSKWRVFCLWGCFCLSQVLSAAGSGGPTEEVIATLGSPWNIYTDEDVLYAFAGTWGWTLMMMDKEKETFRIVLNGKEVYKSLPEMATLKRRPQVYFSKSPFQWIVFLTDSRGTAVTSSTGLAWGPATNTIFTEFQFMAPDDFFYCLKASNQMNAYGTMKRGTLVTARAAGWPEKMPFSLRRTGYFTNGVSARTNFVSTYYGMVIRNGTTNLVGPAKKFQAFGDIRFSEDKSSVSYVYSNEDGLNLYVNDRAYGPYEKAQAALFSPDGSKWAAIVMTDGKNHLLESDGSKWNLGTNQWNPLVTANGRFLAKGVSDDGKTSLRQGNRSLLEGASEQISRKVNTNTGAIVRSVSEAGEATYEIAGKKFGPGVFGGTSFLEKGATTYRWFSLSNQTVRYHTYTP